MARGSVVIKKADLITYYQGFKAEKIDRWKERLGSDLNWNLSFDNLKEKETTKHVHRLHPYKGKFIPQLVEYFIGPHTDRFKRQVFFKKGDIILDPFAGSGTTLIQANELGIHAIGIDISSFNNLITKVKLEQTDFRTLTYALANLTAKLERYISKNNNLQFESELLEALAGFNAQHFPTPEYKIKVKNKELVEHSYGREKEKLFLKSYYALIEKYHLEIEQEQSDTFLGKWYLKPIREEIQFVTKKLKEIEEVAIRKIVAIILSRTVRSCRATTHADLTTLKKPVIATYYCRKHGKICKPIFSILPWWRRYTKDTIKRLKEFDKLRTNTHQISLQGDARNLAIFAKLSEEKAAFGKLAKEKKIKGIFSSPPYLGLIDYHEQHAYAYELFNLKRNDALEIGPMFKGQGREARALYVNGIAQVLNNVKKYLASDYDIFLVANDKYNLYPLIAEKTDLRIVNQYKRPVLNRAEKDKAAYAELIFHLKKR